MSFMTGRLLLTNNKRLLTKYIEMFLREVIFSIGKQFVTCIHYIIATLKLSNPNMKDMGKQSSPPIQMVLPI